MNLNNVETHEDSRLIIEGNGVNSTVLVVDPHKVIVEGRHLSHFTLRRMTLKRPKKMAGQATVFKTGNILERC